MCVLKVGDHALLYVADPMMRCRCPNSEGASSGLLGSPFTGSFCHSTLAISVDFRALRASVKLYPRLADKPRSEEHTSELQSPCNLVCRLLLEKKNRPGAIAVRRPPKGPPPAAPGRART